MTTDTGIDDTQALILSHKGTLYADNGRPEQFRETPDNSKYVVYGGASIEQQIRALKKGHRSYRHTRQAYRPYREKSGNEKCTVVLDEADGCWIWDLLTVSTDLKRFQKAEGHRSFGNDVNMCIDSQTT